MSDVLGWRLKFGVIVPSTNTSVQPEFEAMAPRGVTNHTARIMIPDMDASTDEAFLKMMEVIRANTEDAIDSVVTCKPDYVVMGMSAETFWDGADGAEALKRRMEARAGCGIAMGSHAVRAALDAVGGGKIKRIAVLTPYQTPGDQQVVRFFAESGYEVVRIKGLKCRSPVLIAHETETTLRRSLKELDGPDVDALVQVGTNLACARIAAEAEEWLEKPVLAINTATYWHALRQNGIIDKIDGFGSLLAYH